MHGVVQLPIAPGVEAMALPRSARRLDGCGGVVGGVVVLVSEAPHVPGVGQDDAAGHRAHARDSPSDVGTTAKASTMVAFDALSCASRRRTSPTVEAVRRIPGVNRVQSRLHVGLFPSDTQPSEGGERHAPSRALTAVLAAAHGGGAVPGSERSAARAVLSTFAAQLPRGERRHFLCHLPEDLRSMVEEPRPRGAGHPHVRRLDDFVSAVGLPPAEREQQEYIVESVLGAVRELVPEEARDVAAVLPPELREFWKTAIPH